MDTAPRYRATAIFSRSATRIPNLGSFLTETERLVPARGRLPKRVDSVAGWGVEPASERARALAGRRDLPFLAIEGGLLASIDRTAAAGPPMSLIVDPVGMYYDATRPSALENLLQAPDTVFAVHEAIGAIARIQTGGAITGVSLSSEDALEVDRRPLVVVVDQVRGDASVDRGLGSERQFTDMLDAAIDEHPDALVLVRRHPKTITGRARGYLEERARKLKIPVLEREVDPVALVERARRVYTVTSEVGMMALVCGAPVTCFGMPFYAGWGATDDRVICARRTMRRSALEIFAAAYFEYPRYVDPLTGTPCSFKRVLERLEVMKRAHELSRGHIELLGVDRRKRPHVRRFFVGEANVLGFAKSTSRAVGRARTGSGRVFVEASSEPEELGTAARRANVPVVRMEEGFIGSPGRTTDLLPSASMIFDARGIFYDPRGLSGLEEILEFEEFDEDVLHEAATLRRRIVETRLSKFKGLDEAPVVLPEGDWPRILVPGQCADDPALKVMGGGIRTNRDLVEAVRQFRPDALVVFKPHPEVEAGRRPALDDAAAAELAHAVVTGASPDAAIAAVDEVHTLTSLLGFEALLRGCRVATYGGPFYAGWGLTDDYLTFPRRTRRLSLDELVAGALILYPSYIDPRTGLPCDAMTVVERLADEQKMIVDMSLGERRLWRRLRLALRDLAQSVRPAA